MPDHTACSSHYTPRISLLEGWSNAGLERRRKTEVSQNHVNRSRPAPTCMHTNVFISFLRYWLYVENKSHFSCCCHFFACVYLRVSKKGKQNKQWFDIFSWWKLVDKMHMKEALVCFSANIPHMQPHFTQLYPCNDSHLHPVRHSQSLMLITLSSPYQGVWCRIEN